jgi:hypothetical protein
LTKERDHLQEDVIGVERAFDDLHRRFEKLKTKVEEFKKVFVRVFLFVASFLNESRIFFKLIRMKKHCNKQSKVTNNNWKKRK